MYVPLYSKYIAMIYYTTPYNLEKNIGAYYNDFMRLLPAEAWACFIDGDARFTTNNFGHQLQDIINANPICNLFTAVTNRVGTKYQCVQGMWDVNDANLHRKKGLELQQFYKTSCIDITNMPPLSGVLILLKKSMWTACGGFLENKMLGIDNSIHYRVRDKGGCILLMKGVYIEHYYRGGDSANKQHLL